MLGAQSVSRSTDTNTMTTAPLAENSIHNRLLKACSLVHQTNPTLRYLEYVWLELVGKKIVTIVCPIHFDTRFDKMDFSAAIYKLLCMRYVKI